MIYAILLIFFGMTSAEQTVIIQAACDIPTPKVINYAFDSREGVTETFRDGSSVTTNDDATRVRSADGIELYYSSQR